MLNESMNIIEEEHKAGGSGRYGLPFVAITHPEEDFLPRIPRMGKLLFLSVSSVKSVVFDLLRFLLDTDLWFAVLTPDGFNPQW
jgi:hypothetical protein